MEMTCAEARAALARGDEELRLGAHIAACEACAAALDAGALPRPPESLHNRFVGSNGQAAGAPLAALADEAGPLAFLRAWPRSARLAAALAVAAALAAAAILSAPREDLATYPLWRMGLLLGAHALVVALAAFHALRPLWLPPAPTRRTVWLVVSALAASALVALLPELPTTARSAVLGLPDAPVCLLTGLGAATLLVVLVRPLDRGEPGSARPLLALAAAGVASDAALHLHCPHNEREHLALGHTGMFVLVVGGALTWQLARRARHG